MRTNIRVMIALFLVIVLSVGVLSYPAFAATQASDYIISYSVGLSQGTSNGQLKLRYSIIGPGNMDTIGVSKIVVYKSNGTKYRTIYGTVSNGLLEQNTFSLFDDYYFTVATGYSYYCQVTFYSGKDGGYDTRTVTTSTVAAPIISSP